MEAQVNWYRLEQDEEQVKKHKDMPLTSLFCQGF